MKNSILKSYLKKFIRSEAFISVIIVFVLAIGIIGTSYGLYMDVDTDTNYQLVEVGDLSVGFDNGSNIIELTNMLPTSDEIAIKQTDNLASFYIYNTGTYTANYNIKLVSSVGNQVETKFINYQICKDNADNCKDISTLNESGETIIYTDELSPNKSKTEENPSAYYFIRIWINDQYNGSSENKTIKLQVVIDAKNASGYLDNDNTLAGAILSNPNIAINNTIPVFNGIADYNTTGDSTSGEIGLFKAEDDYGISYFFRGAQSYNYVNFAGFTWRVVRINGDGTIRLILEGTLDKVKVNGTAVGSTTLFPSSPYNDNTYVGYMYGFPGGVTNKCLTKDITTDKYIVDSSSTYTTKEACEGADGRWAGTAYETTHINVNNSTIKTAIDTFYETYITSNYKDTDGNIIKNSNNVDSSGKGYENYLADTIFCGDKTLASGYTSGTGTTTTQYGAYDRLSKSLTTSTPTLECASGANDNYSRYTVSGKSITNKVTANEVTTNGDLTYPIALLSADELVMAGAFRATPNKSYYLYDAYKNGTSNNNWWAMSPRNFNGGRAYVFDSSSAGSSLDLTNSASSRGVRPVINLKADVLYAGGDGTSETPYEIKY